MSGVTEIIVLKANQVLQLQVGSLDGRPTFAEYTHSELLGTLVRKERKSSSRKSKTVEAKVSRGVGLMCRALITGRWSTGAPINRPEIFQKLISGLTALSDAELAGLSTKAKKAIDAVLENSDACSFMPTMRQSLYLAFYRGIER